jgi:putative transposase
VSGFRFVDEHQADYRVTDLCRVAGVKRSSLYAWKSRPVSPRHRPDRWWVQDITQHRTDEGWGYMAVVIDAWSRRVVGWSIADHLRAELVVDALEMARLRRQPTGTVVHADHGSQYCSWVFGQRLCHAGLLGSMGTVGDALDNAVAESFFASLQCELLDRHHWHTRTELARAMIHYVDAFYNPHRRHSTLGYLSPIDYETAHAA